MALAILRPRAAISPTIVRLRTDLGPIGQTLLANAITLTPGTVTLDVHDGELRVHCLTRAAADELQTGNMDRRVSAVTAD